MGSAPVSASLMAATHQAFPKAAVTNAYGTTEAGMIVFGPHPERAAAAGIFGRLQSIPRSNCGWSTAATATPSRACWK